MPSDAQRLRDAAARYGRSLNPIARRYVNPVTGKRLSGEALILKTLELESHALSDPEYARNAVSDAGARKWAQFMPGTRRDVIKRFGVDPWRSPEEAVRALTLHMRGKLGHGLGLEGYNPGMPEYPSLVLNTRVGRPKGSAAAPRMQRPGKRMQAPSFEAGTQGLALTLQAAAQQLEAPRMVPVSPLPTPVFSGRAALAMPEGFRSPVSGGGPVSPEGGALAGVLREAAAATAGQGVDFSVDVPRGGDGGRGARPGGATPRGALRNAKPATHLGVKPHVARSAGYLIKKYGIENAGGYRASDPFPDHPSGKAVDYMVGNTRAGHRKGDVLVQELIRNHGRHRVKYIIWKQRIWYPGQGWRKMEDRGSPTQNHMDHPHVLYR